MLYENYTNALNNLANILKQTSSEELHEASKLLQRACQLDPEFATGWMNLATVEMSLGNFQKSEQYFYRALVLRPNHSNTHFNMGNLVSFFFLQTDQIFDFNSFCFLTQVY